uniref:Nuclear pore complex protein Nup88 n=1 Tax=Parasteatoda tepidariorum TaxID=114398 RepID=A0A2L2Y686_PARTP
MTAMINQNIISNVMLEKLSMNKTKYNNVKESKNLFAIYEQYAFVWHDNGSCILTVQLNSKENHENKVKELTLTNPPIFDVESILFNQTGSLLALSGKNGVMIYEVPWRYGKFGTPGSDEDNIIGRSWNIAETFFVCSNRIGVVQVAWHPGSSSSTHLTVLSTDNYIRIYDVTDPQAPQQVISLGSSTKSSFLTTESKINFSTCFGENAISFDFGPSEEVEIPYYNKLKLVDRIEKVVIWPIYLLHSSGDIYVVKAPMKKEKSQALPKVMGPLTMYPQSEDNYGYDACYILCLHTTPPCIILATSSGIMYHCLVLETLKLNNENKFDAWDFENSSESCDISLYVFESVELPLTLSEEQDDVYSHPIRLHKDMISQCKYHCTHISGLHSVAVPFLKTIEEYLETEKLEKLLSSEEKQTCIVEHILCTKPLSEMESVPVLGLDVSVNDASVNLICLLASWEFLCFPLVCSYFSPPPHLLSENFVNSEEDVNSSIPSFEQLIEKALSRSVSCPYLKSQATSGHILSSPQQQLDFLCGITQRYREEYIQKLNTAQALLRSRIKVLVQQKEYQLRDIARSQQEKEALRIGAERLAEKYEEAKTSQQKLFNRIETVLQKLQQNSPHLSKAEINMNSTLLSYEEKLKDFKASLDLIKKKLKLQNDKLKETDELASSSKSNLNNLTLTEVQTKHIKELISKEGDSISELMKKVNIVKKQVTV